MKHRLKTALLAAALAAAPGMAAAKVTFTGYGDLRYDAGANFIIGGPAATLTKFSSNPQDLKASGFSANAVGLFASTELQDNLQFLMDVTFKNIGNTVGSTNVQYAYLNWTPLQDTIVQGGRATLPFGYFNENRFYSFQRYALSPPVFQSSILGLPIADWGVVVRQRFRFRPFDVETAGYVVNGYGNASGQGDALRSASIPGGTSLANNLRAADNNHKPSFGGRASLQRIAGQDIDTGVSYYWGDWDSSGLNPMYMVDYHLHAAAAGFDLLLEALHIGVRGDNGFANSIGSPSWSTDGGFVTLSYDRFKLLGRLLAPYVQYESYRSRPNNGDADREILTSFEGGAALKVSPQLMLKAEYLDLGYVLPDRATGGSVSLDGYETQLAAVLTF